MSRWLHTFETHQAYQVYYVDVLISSDFYFRVWLLKLNKISYYMQHRIVWNVHNLINLARWFEKKKEKQIQMECWLSNWNWYSNQWKGNWKNWMWNFYLFANVIEMHTWFVVMWIFFFLGFHEEIVWSEEKVSLHQSLCSLVVPTHWYGIWWQTMRMHALVGVSVYQCVAITRLHKLWYALVSLQNWNSMNLQSN